MGLTRHVESGSRPWAGASRAASTARLACAILAALICAAILATPASARQERQEIPSPFGPDGTSASEFSRGGLDSESVSRLAFFDAQPPGPSRLLAIGSHEDRVYQFDASAGYPYAPLDFGALGTPYIEGLGLDEARGPEGKDVAVDATAGPSRGQVYVLSGAERKLDGFAADGEPLSGAGEHFPISFATAVSAVAVDSSGDLWVAEAENGTISEYDSGGVATGRSVDVSSLSEGFTATVIAFDAQDNLYAGRWNVNGGLWRIPLVGGSYDVEDAQELRGASAGVSGTFSPRALAVDDSTDHVFVATESREVQEFDVGGPVPTRLAPLKLVDPQGGGASAGLAVDPATDDVFVADAAEHGDPQQIHVFGPPVTYPDAVSGPVVFTPPDTATMTGEVRADGTEPADAITECRFEYVPQAQYEASGFEGLTAAEEASCSPGPGDIPVDEEFHPVSAEVGGLPENATYHYRLIAANENGPTVGEAGEFTTPVAPTIAERPAAPITDTAAQLQAEINPHHAETSYHFEWGTQACSSHTCLSVPIPDGEINAGGEGVVVAATIAGLSPQTTYHFRIVADNGYEVSPDMIEVVGGDQEFTTTSVPPPPPGEPACANPTPRVGPSAALPSCRAYELVTPAEKTGGQGVGTYHFGGDFDNVPGIAAAGGERFVSSSEVGNLVPGTFLYFTDYAFSERLGDTTGWVSHSPFTHPEYASSGGAVTVLQPVAASDDLSTFAWQETFQGSVAAFLFPQMSAWPVSAEPKPGYVEDWEGRWELTAPTVSSLDGPSAQFVSADGSKILFQTLSHGQLGEEDPSLDQAAGSEALYEDDVSAGLSDEFTPDGVRGLVGVCTGEGEARTKLPSVEGSGKIGARACLKAPARRSARLLGSDGAAIGDGRYSAQKQPGESTQGAVSADGRRIFFMSPDPSVAPRACEGTGTLTTCPPQLYIRQLGAAGEPTVRWISRSEVASQEASLTGPVRFEGASASGSRVFFASASPLTADDPNGTGASPVTTGTPSPASWDLYQYEVPSNSAGEPDGADPGEGSLTRVSAGPTGEGDCNVSSSGETRGETASLRFASKDGARAYFVCSAPLAGVPTDGDPTDGTITAAAGAPTGEATKNLYLYDSTKPVAQRWEFIARLPTVPNGSKELDGCATKYAPPNQPFFLNIPAARFSSEPVNCFKGSADGRFVTFMTSGRLVAGDPDAGSVDLYAYDEETDRLTRIDAPQQGQAVAPYGCIGPFSAPSGFCYADDGFNTGLNTQPESVPPLLGVASEPARPGEEIAFFESKSALLPADTNGQFDVYEWKARGGAGCGPASPTYVEASEGCLYLLSTGKGELGSYYSGNSASGRDVFIETRDQLSWQDHDGVMDIYDAREDGGIVEPAVQTTCDVLARGCEGSGSPAPQTPGAGSETFVGPSNPAPKVNHCRSGFAKRHSSCVKKKQHRHKTHHQKKKQHHKKKGAKAHHERRPSRAHGRGDR
jgi:hypothetical protein